MVKRRSFTYSELLEYAKQERFSDRVLPEELQNITFKIIKPTKRKARQIVSFYREHRNENEKVLISLFQAEGDPAVPIEGAMFMVEAKLKDEIIGYFWMPPFHYLFRIKRREVQVYSPRWPVVHKKYRGNNISYFLLLALIMECRNRDIKILFITTYPAIILFYNKEEKEHFKEREKYANKLIEPMKEKTFRRIIRFNKKFYKAIFITI